MSNFGGLQFTNKGRNLKAKAEAGAPLVFTKIKIGSGSLGGQSISTLNDLITPIKTLDITKCKPLSDGTAVIGTSFNNNDLVTGFYWRELGLFATDPDLGEILYCYGNMGATAEYIPPGGGPDIVEKSVDIIAIIGTATSVSAVINESLVYVTKTEIEDTIIDLDAKLASGTATALTVSLPSATGYRAGMKITIIAASNNGGAATTLKVNSLTAKPVYKANTTTAPTLKAGKPYTLILSADLSHFFLEASAEGDAVAANVLAGKTFSSDDDTGLTGTMVNRGSVGTVNLTTEGAEYTIPAGYHNGLGKVKAVIAGLIASVIKAGTTVGGIVGTFTSDATAAAGDLLSGKKAYVNGNLVTGNIPVIGNAHITAPQRTAGVLSGDTPGVNYAYIMPAKGYYDGNNSWARYPEPYLGAQYIKAGATIMGVTGTLTPLDLLPGENVWASADNNASVSSTSYQVKKEIVVGVSGTVRVKMRLYGGSSTTMYGQIRKNGVPVGTERTVSGYNSSGVIFTEDISVTAGERIEFWCRTDNGYQGWYDQFRLCTLASYPSFNVSRNQ